MCTIRSTFFSKFQFYLIFSSSIFSSVSLSSTHRAYVCTTRNLHYDFENVCIEQRNPFDVRLIKSREASRSSSGCVPCTVAAAATARTHTYTHTNTAHGTRGERRIARENRVRESGILDVRQVNGRQDRDERWFPQQHLNV